MSDNPDNLTAAPAWTDPTGDVWVEQPDGTLTALGYPEGELTNWTREDVERVWGQLTATNLNGDQR